MKIRHDKVLIEDIIQAIENIINFLNNIDYKEFVSNELIHSATERKFEIIGEATSKLSNELIDKYEDIPWNKMKAVRNIVIHGYFNVDLEILYNTAIVDLPPLKNRLERILEEI